MNERLEEMETRIAFQDSTIQDLSDIVASQQKEIERLLLAVAALEEQVRSITPSLVADQAEEVPPPHY